MKTTYITDSHLILKLSTKAVNTFKPDYFGLSHHEIEVTFLILWKITQSVEKQTFLPLSTRPGIDMLDGC